MRRLLLICFLLTGFVLASIQAQDEPVAERETITLPISMYILVDDADDPSDDPGSQRTEDDIRSIVDGMNDIWAQAAIVLELQTVEIIEVSDEILRDIATGNFSSFFRAIQRSQVEVPSPTLLNGFYAREIGGPNGIANSRNTFFVMDSPSVFDRRVSSHEVGHLLGLHHTTEDRGRLLFGGTNGMTLTEEEIVVARYFAQGMLDGMR